MFFFNGYFYTITIVLQAICVFHCIRTGKQTNWIWLIVFLPLIGSIAYFFTEIINRRGMQQVQSGVGAVFNPTGSIRKLEENLRFSDTFNNRVALAEAYQNAGQTSRAIELYESSLTGAFTENEYVLTRLTHAYFDTKRYEDVIRVAKPIYKLPQFARSRAHIFYAMSLGYTGQMELAENEFRMMQARFSNFEARFQYSIFLRETGRPQEARKLLTEIVDESSHLSSRERRYYSEWFMKAKDELKRS